MTISFITSLSRWLAQISVIAVKFDVKCFEFSSTTLQNLQSLLRLRYILAIYFPIWQCPQRKPVRTNSVFLLSSSMVVAPYLLKFPNNTLECFSPVRFCKRNALSFSSLSLFFFAGTHPCDTE